MLAAFRIESVFTAVLYVNIRSILSLSLCLSASELLLSAPLVRVNMCSICASRFSLQLLSDALSLPRRANSGNIQQNLKCLFDLFFFLTVSVISFDFMHFSCAPCVDT